MSDPEDVYAAICEEVGTVLVGNTDILEGLTVSMLTGGHILLEGVPGVAKTTIAKLYAAVTGLEFQRIQMTPDVLPADITGTYVYKENTGEFTLQRGPIFSNLVLADEINRATPKTQSALLEAMEERQVTIEGDSLELPRPFMVIATQNPIEYEGTYNLPEAQRDRFQLKLTVDVPARDQEREILNRFHANSDMDAESVERAVTREDFRAARDAVESVYVDDKIFEYILDVVAETRTHSSVSHGASPRASIAFLQTSKARAAIRGREYVTPDDVKALADFILPHRLVLDTDAELSGQAVTDVVADVCEAADVPEATIEPADAQRTASTD